MACFTLVFEYWWYRKRNIAEEMAEMALPAPKEFAGNTFAAEKTDYNTQYNKFVPKICLHSFLCQFSSGTVLMFVPFFFTGLAGRICPRLRIPGSHDEAGEEGHGKRRRFCTSYLLIIPTMYRRVIMRTMMKNSCCLEGQS